MTNKIKRTLRVGIFIFLTSLYTSCEKSENTVLEQHSPRYIHRLSMSDFASKIKKDETYDKLQSYFFSQKNYQIQSYNRNEQGQDITVLTDEILWIESYGLNYYTFKVTTSSSGNKFYNLVVCVNENQEIIKTELFEYLPTDIWLEDTSQPYSGYVSVAECLIDVNSMFERAEDECIIGATNRWNCGANKDHEPGNPFCDPDNNADTEFIIELVYGPCPEDEEPHFVDVPDGGGMISNPNNSDGSNWTADGGGNGNNNQNDGGEDPTPTPTIPTPPTAQEQMISCLNNPFNGTDENIDPAILDQIRLSQAEWEAFNDYLQNNNCSEGAQQFAIAAIETLQDNDNDGQPDGQVNFTLQNINKLTNPCAKAIFTELENGIYQDDLLNPEVQVPVSDMGDILDLNFSESILSLFNSSDTIHLIIQNGNLGVSNGSTTGATITLDNSYLASATQLSIARTMIHEAVHVYINALYQMPIEFNSMSFRQKIELYAEDNGFNPNGSEEEQNIFQHNFMGQYIDAMAYALYEWDNYYGTGGNLGWDYYQAMAWGGMTQYDIFEQMIPDIIQRTMIETIISNEKESTQDAQGTDCD